MYAPDGNRVYYAYMDIKTAALGGTDIVVSFSDNDGATWTGPILVLDGSSLGPVQFIYDKPWIGTHIDVPGAQPNNNLVYVTATLFRALPAPSLPYPDAIAFTRSTDGGLNWAGSRILDVGRDAATGVLPILVQGSRPIGGLGNDVLVAWFHSGEDGQGAQTGIGGGHFQIRTARSPDGGLTFAAPVIAVQDNFEVPFFLGPLGSYHRWWTTMFPDVEIDSVGVAHIAYVHDPVSGTMTGEDGDVRYIRSAGPPVRHVGPADHGQR